MHKNPVPEVAAEETSNDQDEVVPLPLGLKGSSPATVMFASTFENTSHLCLASPADISAFLSSHMFEE